MDLYEVSLLEAIVFGGFVLIEQARPLKKEVRMTWVYYRHLLLVMVIGSLLLIVFQVLAVRFTSPSPVEVPISIVGVLFFYVWFSFGNYWWHRCKHAYLWPVHRLHHAPQKLTTSLALFRSPVEIVLNLVFLFVMGRVLVDAPFFVCFCALCMEGAAEAYHHSNITVKKSWHWYVLQSPVMHVTHHKKNHHSDNFGTVSLWDTVFRTINVDVSPKYGNTDIGITRYSRYTESFNEVQHVGSSQTADHHRPDEGYAKREGLSSDYRHDVLDQRDTEKGKG